MALHPFELINSIHNKLSCYKPTYFVLCSQVFCLGFYMGINAKCSVQAVTCLVFALILVGCSGTDSQPSKSAAVRTNWLKDGSISISRKIPTITETSHSALGFMPFQKSAPKVTILLSEGILKIGSKDANIANKGLKPKNLAQLTTGDFLVSMIENNPVWHASDQYFLERGMTIPKEGSKERYLKAVLGQSAIFLNDGSAIYSSRFGSDQIKGINLKQKDFKQVAKLLSIGAQVTIK